MLASPTFKHDLTIKQAETPTNGPSVINHHLSASSMRLTQGNRRMLLENGIHLTSSSPFSRWLTSRLSCSKLFVGGLSYDTNETVLKDAFEQHGEIVEVKVICDHKSGKSKGYGFVKFTAEDMACKALREMNGQFLDGRNIRIQYAHKD